ncbi:hypothetical protein V8E36_003147 [Tilletia maclaganii]
MARSAPEFIPGLRTPGIYYLCILSVCDGALLTCLFGRKVLFEWTPSEPNYKLLGKHWPASNMVPLDLGKTLENVKVTLLRHGDFVYMAPGTPHAVFALDNSAMVSFGIKHLDMIRTGMELTGWILTHSSKIPKDFLHSLRNDINIHCDQEQDHSLYHGRDAEAALASMWVNNKAK